MSVINLYEAKTNLPTLVDRAVGGEDIVLCHNGKPLVRLVPYVEQTKSFRKLGQLAGRIQIPEDFDAPLPEEVLAAFEGSR
jgi:prevent-host-death family protein